MKLYLGVAHVYVFSMTSLKQYSFHVKNGVFWDVTPCGSCKNDVPEELSSTIIRVT
jgi:hypothetical protein